MGPTPSKRPTGQIDYGDKKFAMAFTKDISLHDNHSGNTVSTQAPISQERKVHFRHSLNGIDYGHGKPHIRTSGGTCSRTLQNKDRAASCQSPRPIFPEDDKNLTTFGLDFDFKDRQSSDQIVPLAIGGSKVPRTTIACAALPKKVNADLDEDDRRLVDLKRLGYSDQIVADTLADEGRIRYDRKTISSRYSRIIAAIRAQKDHYLEGEIHEWEVEDDEMLIIAYHVASDRVEDEIRVIKERRFQFVAQEMANLNPSSAFSAKACRERFISITNGTALIPTSLDDDPAQRIRERDARIETRNNARISQEAAIATEQELERLRVNAARIAKANAREEASVRKAHSLAEKAKAAADKAATRMAEAAAAQKLSLARAEKAQLLRTGPSGISNMLPNAGGELKRIEAPKGPVTSNATKSRAVVLCKVDDPRSQLSTSQLKHLCKQRKLPTSHNREELLKNLDSSAERMKVAELKGMLRGFGLPITGSREVLKYRLAQADRDNTPYAESLLGPEITVSLNGTGKEEDSIENLLKEGMRGTFH